MERWWASSACRTISAMYWLMRMMPMSSRFRNCLLGEMRRESRAAYSELVGSAARGYGLLPESTEDKGKGCYTKLSILSRINFIQKLRVMAVRAGFCLPC